MRTLIDLLEETSVRYGDRAVLSTHVGLRDRAWSYRMLRDAASAIAGYLRRHQGLDAGSPVVVWGPNSPELAAAYFGVMSARLILVPIDPAATAEFVEKVVATTGAGLVISAFPIPPGTSAPSVALDALPFSGDGRAGEDRPAPEDVAEVVFTSGTTGDPKGVMLTHANIVTNIESALHLVPSRPLRLISMLPLSHMLEQTVGLYGPMALGSTIHYPTTRRGPVVLKAMRRQSTNAMVLVPQVLELMWQGIEREVQRRGALRRWERAHRIAARLPLALRRLLFRRIHRTLGGRLDFVICGGAALPLDLAEAWERIGIRVIEGYGATECAPIVSGNTYWDRRPGTVGRPVPGVAVRRSPAGEVLVRGCNVSAAYWTGPGSTIPIQDADGWYGTGDLGEWDEAGNLRITGRLSDRIVLASGLNVYPEDIERELCDQPEIADCVVVPVPDRAGTVQPHAVVIPADPGGTAGREDLAEALRRAGGRLAPHQRVSGYTVWPQPDFPRTNLLKVKRYEVVAALGSSHEAPPKTAGPQVRTVEDEVLDQVRRLLARVSVAEPASVGRESDLSLDLGLDSLRRVELAVLLEDELGLEIEDGQIAELGNVEQLCSLIESTEGTSLGPGLPAWPRGPAGCAVRRVLQAAIIFPLHRLVASPFRVEADPAPIRPPVLMIANHSSHLDTPSILRALPPPLRSKTAVAAAADYFYRSSTAGALASAALGTFPFSRSGTVRSSLEHCGELVDEGWAVLIYPEGTRSTSGVLQPFRSGIAFLAAELEVPVIPIGVSGTHTAWPKGARRPRRSPVTVRIGAPIHVAADCDPTLTIERLERAVAELLDA